MLNETLGNYIGKECKIKLLKEAQPCYTKIFPIPKIHEETLKTEVQILVKIGVLKHKNDYE